MVGFHQERRVICKWFVSYSYVPILEVVLQLIRVDSECVHVSIRVARL